MQLIWNKSNHLPSYWYVMDDKGYFHREDGPAVIYDSGTVYWYKHGQMHREDGPAVITAGGKQYWYLKGMIYTKEFFLKELSVRNKLIYINGKPYLKDGRKIKDQ